MFFEVLGSFGGRFGPILEPLAACGLTGVPWEPFGVALGSLWELFGTVFGSFWEHFGSVLGGKLVTFCDQRSCRVQKVVPSGSEEGRSAF